MPARFEPSFLQTTVRLLIFLWLHYQLPQTQRLKTQSRLLIQVSVDQESGQFILQSCNLGVHQDTIQSLELRRIHFLAHTGFGKVSFLCTYMTVALVSYQVSAEGLLQAFGPNCSSCCMTLRDLVQLSTSPRVTGKSPSSLLRKNPRFHCLSCVPLAKSKSESRSYPRAVTCHHTRSWGS